MTGTPARDALAAALSEAINREFDARTEPFDLTPEADAVLRNPSKVIAALVETGWRPSDEDLRAMGGHPAEDARWVGYWRFPRPEEDPHG